MNLYVHTMRSYRKRLVSYITRNRSRWGSIKGEYSHRVEILKIIHVVMVEKCLKDNRDQREYVFTIVWKDFGSWDSTMFSKDPGFSYLWDDVWILMIH